MVIGERKQLKALFVASLIAVTSSILPLHGGNEENSLEKLKLSVLIDCCDI